MEVFLLVTAGWIFSVCLHEFGHAIVAYHGGDYTVKDKGYLTLNPLHYTHPLYSLVMPLLFLMMGGIGLPGGAVYIEDHLLRSKGWRTAVSLAGPAMNLVLIVLLCIPFWTGLMDQNFGPAVAFLIQLEISAVLFNLIPIPPLDGFQAWAPWISEEVSHAMMANANMFNWLLFLFMWRVPFVNEFFWGVVFLFSNLLGIDSDLAREGFRQYQFWKL
jgi:Zn-dependent protease